MSHSNKKVRRPTKKLRVILCRVRVRLTLTPVGLCVLVNLLTATAPAAMASTIVAANAALHAHPTTSTTR